jgi:hypothetical protein
MKPRTALRAFVLAVVVAAVLALAALPRTEVLERVGLLLLLVGLGAVAGARPVCFPGLRIQMTPIHAVILVGLGALGPMAAALTGLAGVVGATLGRGHPPVPIRFAFNLGAVTLSTAAAAGALFLAGGRPTQELASMILPLSAATAALFIANTGLLSAAIALEKREGFIRTWRTSFSWSPVSYVCGLTVAVAVLAAIDNIALWAVVFGLPMCWVLTAFYRYHAENILAGTPGRTR